MGCRGVAMGLNAVKRFDVYLVALDPTLGSETQKRRPCLVISPDEMNRFIRTINDPPMTSRKRNYPTRINCTFQGTASQVVLDQIRTVDKARLVKRLGKLNSRTQTKVLLGLEDLFA